MTDRHETTPVECDRLTEYLLGELSEEQMSSFAVHLTSCLRCQQEWTDLQLAHTLLTEAPWPENDESAQTGEPDGVKHVAPANFEALKATTLQAAFAVRAPEATPVSDSLPTPAYQPLVSRKSTVRRARNGWLGVIGAGAAVILGIFLVVHGSSGVNRLLGTPLKMEASATFPHTHGVLMMKRQADMMQLTLALKEMPPAPANGCYELWVVTQSGKHIGFGEFVPAAGGQATVTAMVPQSLSFVAVGVTREPQWGDKKPLGKMVVHMQMDESV
ncbi:MAG: anti-sigma factor [Firmicutes bacterium]|nr:anti-sigma factor [Bacillota bacterium]